MSERAGGGKKGINYIASYERMKGQKREHFPLPAPEASPLNRPIEKLLTGSRNVAGMLIKFPT